MKKNFLKSVVMAVVLTAAAGIFSACGDDGGFVEGREINVISREDGSGTRGAFIDVMGIYVGGVDRTTVNAEIAPGTSHVLTNIAGDRYAIGYISLGSLNDTVRAINVGGVAATEANVRNGSYPLFRTFYLAVSDGISPLAQDFLDFMVSAEGQEIVERNYIPALESPSPFTGGGHEGTIVVAGSTSVAPLMERMREAYIALNPGVSIEIQSVGSGGGINAARDGMADIGMSSRDLREGELVYLNAIAVALDGLAVIVNNDNTATNLSPDQIHDIFVGEITRWNELD
ncbi:MAG: substrate-binding domain-containing protein [Defluviitaleaceae bacterium]|nr:substrate-binding domain-containing protein [Defluviitaleaceae bacterium]